MAGLLKAVTPAPVIDVIDLYARHGVLRRLALKVAMVQVFKSETFAFYRADGLCLAVIGFCPIEGAGGEDEFELWFVTRPEIEPSLVRFIRIARLTLRKVADTTGLRILAIVRQGHRPGQRLAKMVGLKRADILDGVEFWSWRSGGRS